MEVRKWAGEDARASWAGTEAGPTSPRVSARLAKLGLVSAALFLLLTPAAQALSLQYLTPAERAGFSGRIVHGTVTSLAAVEAPEGGLETRVTLRVHEMLKGPAADEVVFTIPGGASGERITYVPGMPQYEAGQQCVVFLQTLGDGTSMPVGLPQGSFHVERVRDGSTLVVPDADPLELDGASSESDQTLAAQPLDRFLATVRGIVKKGAAGEADRTPAGGSLGARPLADVAPPPAALPAPEAPAPVGESPTPPPSRWPWLLAVLLIAGVALRRRR